MSSRDAEAAGRPARHARDRLQATLGDARRGLLLEGGEEHVYGLPGGDGAGLESRPGQPAATGGTAARTGSAGPALRWRLGPRVAVLLGIVAVAVGAVFWWQAAAGRPQVLPLGGASTESPAPAGDEGEGRPEATGAASPGAYDPGGTVVTHVAGAVAAPGIVRLPAGSRVHEAIAAAGGGTPDADLNRLNLAVVVEDGQKIDVPRHGEALPGDTPAAGTPGAAADGGSTGAAGAKTNLNTASVAELDALPRVGPVLAQRIVDWRTEHGAFKSVEELDAVDGVGPKMLEALLPLVTV